jgi:hypothetical protein
MGTLFVITVPDEFLPAEERGGGAYAVILGDGVLPGHYLGRYEYAAMADSECVRFAAHYGLDAYPFDSPWSRRMGFVVLKGGKADQ